MSAAARQAESKKHRTGGSLFSSWQQADQCVPYPTLYRITILPAEGKAAAPLEELVRFEFVYRITESYVARFSSDMGRFHAPALYRESYNFRLMPILGSQGLISPTDAEKAIKQFLKTNSVPFWPQAGEAQQGKNRKPHPHARLHWRSLLLEQPFRAGVVEPYYIFQSESGFHEFCVGARTQDVQLRLARNRQTVV